MSVWVQTVGNDILVQILVGSVDHFRRILMVVVHDACFRFVHICLMTFFSHVPLLSGKPMLNIMRRMVPGL